ncbi:methyltransferase domain-containing protein [Diaminobutyricibacter tongyongensis]|uniref:Methyltransferase domain-containing protein n=1 Tax=Leifsonia tongyongensis TaxID=1268043 RepID=A0A6L9XWN9_9MICO|nr:methyltransferase domain-containing protein [Diaminobutyricibacter tongyongensis]
MVTFDARAAVTSPEAWDECAEWAGIPTFDGTEFGALDQVVVFSAHADDETLGAGGLLARVAGHGIPVRVVVATGGSERIAELRDALSELGVPAEVEALGLTDGDLKNESDRLRAHVESVLSGCTDRWLVLAPWPGDRHGDHRTLGREVGEILQATNATLLFYPVWLWQWGTPDDVPWARLIDAALSAQEQQIKAAAIDRFTSQLESPSNPSGVLTPEFVLHAATAPEVLIRPEWSVNDAHFEDLHRRLGDPWSVRTDWYERRKRALTVASLPRERYGRALELGCSIGETTASLAERCDALVAVDHAAAAVATASERVADFAQVSVERMRIPAAWPDGDFDLIVISELAYYLAADQWERTIDRCRESLAPRGNVLLCHWLGDSDDFAQTGEAAHEAFRARSGLTQVVAHREPGFLLEVFA